MKKDSWSKLPNEILLNIFQRNDNSTKSQCSLTCRDWKYTAQCALFEKITISNEEKWTKLSNAISIIQNKSYGVKFGQSPGNYVKIVNCRCIKDLIDWKLLDEMFPFLEIMEINKYGKTDHNDIYRLLKAGKFQHLQRLPTIESNETPLELLFDRREKIEELELYSLSLEDKILQNLHLFLNLKILNLHYTQEVHLEKIFSNEILHVKSINIFFGFRNLVTSTRNIDEIQPFPNTREIKIDCNEYSSYDNKFILYIMKKFPNLEKLSLINYPDFRKYNCEFPTVDCLFQFLVYLSKMKKDSDASLVTNDITTQLLQKFLSYQPTVFYKNTNITLRISFNVIEPQHIPPDITEYVSDVLTIENKKRGGYKKDQCNLFVKYHVMQGDTFRSHSQLFKEVGDKNIIELSILSQCHLSFTIPVVLDEIFSHFSTLEFLIIWSHFNFVWNKEVSLVEETLNSTIKHMEYIECTVSKDMFPMISRTCQNLKFLYLTNCRYTNNNEDQTISRYFPIFMPSTCLEILMISLDNDHEFQYKKAFIRLITNNKKPRYCKITTETGSPIISFPEQDCTENHYNTCLDDKECGVFDIHCKAVVKLTVEFATNCDGMLEHEEINGVVDGAFFNEREYIEEDL